MCRDNIGLCPHRDNNRLPDIRSELPPHRDNETLSSTETESVSVSLSLCGHFLTPVDRDGKESVSQCPVFIFCVFTQQHVAHTPPYVR